MNIGKRALGIAALTAVALVIPLGSCSVGSAAVPPRPTAHSLLIITLPATSWNDVREGPAPNLTKLFRQSALANLATRTVATRTLPGTGYLAVGTGTRSFASPDAAALALNATERFAGLTAAEIYRTRTGHPLRTNIGQISWPAIVAENRGRSYGAEPGVLGQALADAGIGRRVIANADERTETGPVLHREAALILVDTHGTVRGRVSRTLLEVDHDAPFGWRLNPNRVLGEFPTDFSTRRQVVTVEASDLARADRYRPFANARQRDRIHHDALAASDAMIGRLLERVDARRDAVMVIAPYHSSRARTLTVAAIRGPGIRAGLMESATTRRAGFLQIVDVAPTVLDLLGRDRTDSMEGRPARFHADADSYRARIDGLVKTDRAAQFRDATIGQATATLVTATIVLVAAAIAGLVWFRRRWTRLALRWASLMLLGFVAATFLVGMLPLYRWGTATYFVIIATLAVAFAALCLAAGRRGIADPLLVAFGLVISLHVIDLVTGPRLELNTVFGYSPTVGIRLAGIGNPASAELSAAALLFAVLIAWRLPRRGDAVGYSLLAVVLVVIAAPMWGQDFGGGLALAPTLALWWLLRSGRRVNLRTIATIGVVLVVTGLIAGFADLSRPANERTHVGRFFEKVGTDGLGGFLSVIGRKASLMINTFSNTAWVLLVLSVLMGIALAARRSHLLERVLERVPTLRPGLVCFAVLTVLATVLNDSGVQVTGMLLATLLPALVFLGTHVADEHADSDGQTNHPPVMPTDEPKLVRSRA